MVKISNIVMWQSSHIQEVMLYVGHLSNNVMGSILS